MNIRARSIAIFNRNKKSGLESLRKIAGKIGVSKSSVQRHKKAIVSRQCFPESEFWETEAGINWLMRMYVAVLLEFGINCGVGADQISRFFKRIRIAQHIGVSASSNRKRMQLIEKALIEYQRSHEQIAKNSGKEIEIVGSGDETFFCEIMMLVLMDLRSGYIVLEETAEDRTYDTWQMKAKKRLNELVM